MRPRPLVWLSAIYKVPDGQPKIAASLRRSLVDVTISKWCKSKLIIGVLYTKII